MKFSQIYCDMDGVLADFAGGFAKLRGLHGQEAVFCQKHWESEEPKHRKMIADHAGFWENLDWAPGGKQLWDHIKKYKPHILSTPFTPDEDPTCVTQKMVWIEKNLEEAGDAYLVRRTAKIRYSWDQEKDLPNLLIDDYIKTVLEWRNCGAIAIHHTSVEDTISHLIALGVS